jgi:hypothetical protein
MGGMTRTHERHMRSTMSSILLTIAFGVVGLVLSYGFFIPTGLSMFRLIAAIGMMIGY